MSPTGLAVREVHGLDRGEKLALAEWHASKSGSNEGRLWLPGRIRAMPVEGRLALALDPDLDRVWEARERRRVVRDPSYFVRGYGAVQPGEGAPVPFELWPEQEEALREFHEWLRVIVLKARQLGLTWLAIHYALWIMAFSERTPNARVLALSKKGADADLIIERTRKLNDLLPPFLSHVESFRTRESNSRFRLRDRGAELVSLMGTPEAARSNTATLLLADEFGFLPNEKAGPTWTSAQPTLGERGRAIVISTGNGRGGNGGAFSMLWDKARADAPGALHPIFLPYNVDPARRREGWREETRGEFLTDEEFEAEYPEDEEQALQGAGSFNVYPHSGISAAVRIGAELDKQLAELAIDGIEWGIDWGDFQTFALYGIPLPNGGLFVFDELILAHAEPADASEQIVYRDPGGLRGATFTKSYADSNPAGTNKTFARVLREAHDADPLRFPEAHRPVPFGTFKEGGNAKKGVNTVAFVKNRLIAAEKFVVRLDAGTVEAWEASGLLAVSPRCKTLVAQMRNLERDAKDGKVKKPTLDPRHVERGDHGPDALVALEARRAAAWRVARS